MDAEISLALAVKLRKIFEKDDRFLTYPVGLGYTYESLSFMDENAALSPQEHLNFKGNFARQMNFIPEDSIHYLPDPGRLLWDDVRGVISEATFAASTLTAAEEKKLADAEAYLQSVDAESNSGYSKALAEYYQYRKILDEAEEIYLNEKLSVEFADGPGAIELKQAWENGRKTELLSAKDRAEQDFITLGHRYEVEENLRIVKNLKPRTCLEGTRSDYLADIDRCELADLNGEGVGFYATYFSPQDAFDKHLPWSEITLTREELKKLVKDAEPELKTMLGGDKIGDDIESMSLEYNNVVIMRPWFRPDFFEATHWKLEGDVRPVSDGEVPASGRIPAWVTSMIVARRITVVKKKSADGKTNNLMFFNKVALNQFKVAQPTIRVGGRATVMPVGLPLPARRMTPARVRPNPAALRAVATPRPVVPPLRPVVPISPALVRAKFKGTTVKTLQSPMLLLRANALYKRKPDTTQYVTETYDLGGITVLALVCKRVPRSPNPDPHLRWQ